MADEVTFPVDSYKEAAAHLRRPFSPAAVRWKIQTGSGENAKGGIVVGYIDARLVSERLNLVCPHLWQTSFERWGERVDTNLLVCHLTIDGLTRSDIGQGQGKDVQKAAYSDSLKRAAVHFGIGVSLYAMKAIWLDATDKGDERSDGTPTLRKKRKGNKTYLELTPACERWLRDTYAKWLETDRGKMFGEALDHGDAEGSAGAIIEGGEGAPEEETQEDLELAADRQEVQALYEEHVASDAAKRRKLPKARFQAQLDGAESSDDLDALREKVEAVAA